MPQFTTFVINDGTATPVAVTYSPEAIGLDKNLFVDRRLSQRNFQPTVLYTWSAPSGQRLTYKPRVAVAQPLVRTVNAVDVVIGTNRADVNFTIAPEATLQERKHLFAMIYNAINHAYVKAGIVDLEPGYGS